MHCLECQEYLQQLLDGAAPALSPDLEEHFAQCSTCRSLRAAGQALQKGLEALPAPVPSQVPAARMAGLVLEDGRLRRRRRLVVVLALAASLLIAALAGHFWPPAPDDNALPGNAVVKKDRDNLDKGTDDKASGTPRLAKSVHDARQAVVALSDRIADGAKEQTKVLLAAAKPMSGIDNLPEVPPALGLEPAAQSLQQAGQAVAEGLQPMATGTRRAFSFFVRELSVLDAKH
jgi:hypothetical protein